MVAAAAAVLVPVVLAGLQPAAAQMGQFLKRARPGGAYLEQTMRGALAEGRHWEALARGVTQITNLGLTHKQAPVAAAAAVPPMRLNHLVVLEAPAHFMLLNIIGLFKKE